MAPSCRDYFLACSQPLQRSHILLSRWPERMSDLQVHVSRHVLSPEGCWSSSPVITCTVRLVFPSRACQYPYCYLGFLPGTSAALKMESKPLQPQVCRSLNDPLYTPGRCHAVTCDT